MADGDKKRKEEFLKAQQGFRENAFKIIQKMNDWANVTPGSKYLVDEILHSIFFLGKINKVPFSPEEIICDEETLDALKEKYPRPFDFYLTQLPRRSPFSCVLDMIVLQKEAENEEEIKQSLRDLVQGLDPGFLVSSTICISQNLNNLTKYYGVSMSTTGCNPGRVVIAASCLSKWDEYVSGAVMTYFPNKSKKNYFDGTIQVPQSLGIQVPHFRIKFSESESESQSLGCEAFRISNGTKLPPCRSCHNLFGLSTEEKTEWPYGHCAEAESLSNLLEKESDIKNATRVHEYSPSNREKAKKEVLKRLNEALSTVGFETWNGEYYRPE